MDFLSVPQSARVDGIIYKNNYPLIIHRGIATDFLHQIWWYHYPQYKLDKLSRHPSQIRSAFIMDLKLENKTVLVTAGSKGIGLATARGFHKEGARVAICGRTRENLDTAAALMPGCHIIAGDVSNAEDIERIVASATETFGGIDILVNNAGGPPPGLFVDLDDSDWAKAVELTLMSVVRATRLVLPHMQAQKWGRIVNISSSGVKQPVPGLTLSNSIRMAVLGWAKTLANQVGPDNILVNTVCPRLHQYRSHYADTGDPIGGFREICRWTRASHGCTDPASKDWRAGGGCQSCGVPRLRSSELYHRHRHSGGRRLGSKSELDLLPFDCLPPAPIFRVR